MMLIDAIRILDESIPPPYNKMVDSEHLNITIAWQEIKHALNVQLKQTYAEKVIRAIRDDGCISLSFKDVETLTADEITQVLVIAAEYGSWLYAVWEKAIALCNDRAEFTALTNEIRALAEKLGYK